MPAPGTGTSGRWTSATASRARATVRALPPHGRLIAFVLLAAACGRGGDRPRVPAGAPIVLISVDTLRADHLPAYGYGGVATPSLDRLRADSVLFRNAWSPAPLTLPSHVTMLTGLLPPRHGVRANAGFTYRGAAAATLPGLLKAQGYATAAAVSSYVMRADTGLARLFDFYEDGIDPSAGGAFGEYQRRGDVTVALAREWIDAHRGVPFFFFLHLYEPHVPYDPPEPFRSRYAPYDGEIASADAIVGGLLDHLRAQALYDRALVIFTSDHGEGLGQHGEDQHSILLYAEALRVPLLVKLPTQQRAGETVEAPAQLADILPTVASLLGLAAPAEVAGQSLLDLAAAGERRIYSETLYPRLALGWSELRSLADARWHFIQGPRLELYDLARDPGETQDLAAAQPEVVAGLRAEMERLHALRVPEPEAVPREVAERLAALGYVAGRGGPAAPGAPPLDPRDGLPVLRAFQAASRLVAEGRLADGEAALRRLLAESPGLFEARLALGHVLMETGRVKEAADAFATAAAGPGSSGDVWIALGEARLREGRLDEADAAAARATPDSPTRAHELRARVALRRGDLAAAEREAQAARERARPLPSSLVLAAEIRARSGDLPGALARLDEAVRLAQAMRLDGVPGLEFQRADALARLGRAAEAEAAYRREIARFPRHLQAWANLGVLLYLQRRSADLDRLMEEMAAANPGPAARDVAAKTFDALGDRKRAATWRRKN
jgi:arylsulfatase A-like enzyme/Flp pilus assembly protein TadD